MEALVELVEKVAEMQANARKEEREKAVQAVMDLFFALKEIGGKPTLRDLVKLAKRIKHG